MGEPSEEQLRCEAYFRAKGHEMMRYPGTDNYVRDYDDGLWDAWRDLRRDESVTDVEINMEVRQFQEFLNEWRTHPVSFAFHSIVARFREALQRSRK